MNKFVQLILLILFLFAQNVSAQDSRFYPDLSGKTLDGKNFELKEKRGVVVIINFWASWCVDCMKELPVLDEIYRDYAARGLEIVSVSTDGNAARNKVVQMMAGKKYPSFMVRDLSKNDFPKVEFLPTSYVLDKNGRVMRKIIVRNRAITKADFEDALKDLM